jgi:tRNA nucleotidyltransferase/poly(A) polymerase
MVSRLKWIPTSRAFPLPPHVKEAIARLSEHGYLAYVVGGSVRDYLLGLPIKDYDLATDATPDEIEEIFPTAIDVGKQFGVMKVPPYDLEIATFREDLEYKNHRHPKGVKFAGPLEDALRRDFTMNALFFDPKTRKILDTVNGIADLEAKTIRAIGDPEARLMEDALRILRAIRFAARYQFGIETETLEALITHVKLLKKVSAERIQSELTLMWKGSSPHQALRALKDTGILSLLLPEALKLKSEVLQALDQDPTPRTTALVWGLVLSEIGGEDPTRALQSVCDRLKFSREDSKRITQLVVDLPKFNDVFQMREATLQRWVRESYFDELLQMHRAYIRAHGGNLMAYRFCEALRREVLAQSHAGEKLLSGEDLIQLGFKPGPTFSEILRTVEDLWFEKKLTTKEEALEYVVKHFVD